MSTTAPAPTSPSGKTAPKMLSLRLESKQIIYASYISFTEFGGVFVPTNDAFVMGEDVMLVLELVTKTNTEKFLLPTKVCWINSNPSAAGRPKGIGLAFGSDEQGVKVKGTFEAILSGVINSEHSTYTL